MEGAPPPSPDDNTPEPSPNESTPEPSPDERRTMREFFDKFDASVSKVMLITACILLSECHYKNLLDRNDSNGALLVVIMNHFFIQLNGNVRMPEKDEPEVFARWINLRHGRSRYQAITNAPEVSEDEVELIGCRWEVWLWDEIDSLWTPEQSSGTEVLPITSNGASHVTNSSAPAPTHAENDRVGEVDAHGDLHHAGLAIKSFTSYSEEDQEHLMGIMQSVTRLGISQERLDERLPAFLRGLRWSKEFDETLKRIPWAEMGAHAPWLDPENRRR